MRSPIRSVVRVLALVGLCMCAALVAPAVAPAEDITPPALTAYSVTPTQVDTTSSSQTCTARLTFEDPGSGVESVSVHLTSALLGQQAVWVQAERVSGDASEGEYVATLTLPCGSAPGTWYVSIIAEDELGNLACISFLQLDSRYGAGAGEVTNMATAYDSSTPQVTAVSITPTHVDTSTAAQTVEVTMTVTDDLSGVDFVFAYFHSNPGSNGQYREFNCTRVSGDELSAVYKGSVTLPRYSAAGSWTLLVNAHDIVGNVLTAADLSEQFGDTALLVNDATVDDTTPPVITSFSVSPTVFDTESGDQTLTATVKVEDDLAGTEWVSATACALLSNQTHSFKLKLSSGDACDGEWTGTVTMPQGAEVGPWRIKAGAGDSVRNSVQEYSEDELAAMLSDTSGLILINTATAGQVTIRKEWTLTGAQSSVTFPADTVVTRTDGGSFAFYRMVAQSFDFTEDLPTDDLQGEPVATLRFGIPGLGLSFSQPVTVRMYVGDRYDGYLVRIQSLQEGGESWAKESQALVTGGYAAFTVDHATRFVAVKAKARVTKVSRRTCRRRARVTITGVGFGKARRGSTVLLGGKVCRTFKRWTPRSVTFVVPSNARLGRQPLVVRVNGVATRAGRLTVRR